MSNSARRRETELKIGDLERQTGVSRSSIQHYVRLGLLPPPRKLGPKLFLFDTAHVETLARVRTLRERERLSLAEIRARLRSHASSPPNSAPPGPGDSRRQRNSSSEDPRRATILEVATRLFARQGYDGVRLVDVARELGLSKAALYRSFASKEELFVDCIDHIRLLVVPREARDAGKREPDFGRRAIRRTNAVLRNFESYRMLTQLLVTVANGRDRDLASKARAAFHRMVTDVVPELQQAVRNGLYRNGDLELDAYMLWGALMGAGDFMVFVRRDPHETMARAYLELMTFGTQPRGARGSRPPSPLRSRPVRSRPTRKR